MTRRLALTLRPDGTLVELGADGDAASVARDVATDVEGCPGRAAGGGPNPQTRVVAAAVELPCRP